MPYTVKRGDTLGKIARDNGMSLSELLELNPGISNPNLIHPGDKVVVDSSDPAAKDDKKEGKSATDYTDDPETRFKGLPGKPEVWKVGDKSFVVYEVPNSDPPIPMAYEVSSKADLESFFGEGESVDYDRTLTTAEANKTGWVDFGSTDEIAGTEGNPWDGFTSQMDTAMETMPWLADDEVFGVFASAWLEGREVEQFELDATDWFQERSEAERDYLYLQMRSPEDAARLVDDWATQVDQWFFESDVPSPPQEYRDYIGRKVATGEWSETYALEQVRGLSGLETTQPLDGAMMEKLSDVTSPAAQVQDYENQVKDLYRTWLGPAHVPSDSQVASWVTRIRNDPEAAEAQLRNMLASQRVALFPEYEDPTLTYEDIASPWRDVATSIWGQAPDETSGIFTDIVRRNDLDYAQRTLTDEGLKRNIGKVVQDTADEIAGQFGNVRTPLA